ncbi:MAG: cytochrome C [Georgfuchsia sp.]
MRTLPAIFILLVLLASGAWAAPVNLNGENIYRYGILPSGEPLRAMNAAGIVIEGKDASCDPCHSRSGLGTREAQFTTLPITGKYLFNPSAWYPEDKYYKYGPELIAPDHVPYTDETLARSISDGIGSNGRELGVIMPRYELNKADMAALIDYLKNLSADNAPGVTKDMLHFATIITPDADPTEREVMLDILNRYFAGKNLVDSSKRRLSSNEIGYLVTHKWQLHVWQLSGAPETWEQQLHQKLAAEPVFAVISGLGHRTWAPVHRFCEQASIPCLLPNVDLPVADTTSFYPIYFSGGTLLEAQLISNRLAQEQALLKIKRVVHVFREGDIGEEAAKAVHLATSSDSVPETVMMALKADGAGQDLSDALKNTVAGDALVLWLRPRDIAALPAAVPGSPVVFMSGLMGGEEYSPLPPAWRKVTHLTYPFDLPERRKPRMNFPHGRYKGGKVPATALRIQADTYIACYTLSTTLANMMGRYVRDYLVERIELMLNKMATAGSFATGYYPLLSLAYGQRFASKGGYIVRFADPSGNKLVAETNWIVP